MRQQQAIPKCCRPRHASTRSWVRPWHLSGGMTTSSTRQNSSRQPRIFLTSGLSMSPAGTSSMVMSSSRPCTSSSSKRCTRNPCSIFLYPYLNFLCAWFTGPFWCWQNPARNKEWTSLEDHDGEEHQTHPAAGDRALQGICPLARAGSPDREQHLWH